MRPKKHLEYYARVYPNAWKEVDAFRAGRGKDLPFWPEWCFIPLAGTYAIVSSEAKRQGINMESEIKKGSDLGMALTKDVGVLAALAAWRVTQGVYRFDADVYKEVINTPITGDLPHDILFNLPEWCVYIETPGMQVFGNKIHGFFAHLEYDAENGGRKELRLVLDYYGKENGLLWPAIIHLGPWSLKEAVERACQEACRNSEKYQSCSNEIPQEGIDIMFSNYAPLVSLLLYLCSLNSQIEGKNGEQPTRPRTKKTKKGYRIFPPKQVSTWDVGVRMGASLRTNAGNIENATTADTQETSKHRNSPRPHIRRAHWHGYWQGPRGNKEFVLKWIPPILVNSSGENLPVTIRPVD